MQERGLPLGVEGGYLGGGGRVRWWMACNGAQGEVCAPPGRLPSVTRLIRDDPEEPRAEGRIGSEADEGVPCLDERLLRGVLRLRRRAGDQICRAEGNVLVVPYKCLVRARIPPLRSLDDRAFFQWPALRCIVLIILQRRRYIGSRAHHGSDLPYPRLRDTEDNPRMVPSALARPTDRSRCDPNHEAHCCRRIVTGDLPTARRRDVHPDDHERPDVVTGAVRRPGSGERWRGSVQARACDDQARVRIRLVGIPASPPKYLLGNTTPIIGEPSPDAIGARQRPERCASVPEALIERRGRRGIGWRRNEGRVRGRVTGHDAGALDNAVPGVATTWLCTVRSPVLAHDARRQERAAARIRHLRLSTALSFPTYERFLTLYLHRQTPLGSRAGNMAGRYPPLLLPILP